MQFFTHPFQGLVVVQSDSSSPVTVIDDIGYKYVKDKKFVSSFNGFKQRDYNQLPGKLIKASEIENIDVKFLSAKKLKESNRAAAEQDDEDDILSFDDREASTFNESAYNRSKSIASSDAFDSQSSSPSEVPSSFMDVETQPKNVFKVPSNKVHSSSRDYNNYKVNRSDASSEEFDSRTLYSDSDLSTSTTSSVVNPKNKKKY